MTGCAHTEQCHMTYVTKKHKKADRQSALAQMKRQDTRNYHNTMMICISTESHQMDYQQKQTKQ